MARAMIGGILTEEPTLQISVIEPLENVRQKLREMFAIQAVAPEKAELILLESEIVILAIKPQHIQSTIETLSKITRQTLLISIVTGIRMHTLEEMVAPIGIIRAMPNTPVFVQSGLTGLYANEYATSKQKELTEQFFTYVGKVLWLEEEQNLDAITALSGSGPAYVFYFLEAMQAAAQTLGFSEEVSRYLSLQTFKGAIQLAAQSQNSFSDLRKQVTSQGGSTEAALNVMQTADVQSIIKEMINAAFERSKALGNPDNASYVS